MTWAYRREERTTGLGAFGRTSFGGWPRRKPRDQFQCPKCRGYTWVFVFWVVPQVRFLNFPFHAIHSIALKFTIDKHTESMECFRMLSRTNLADPSRRSSLNPRPVNLLQPLFYPEPRRVRSQKSQVLYNQANPASFCKTPGWGVPSQISPLESATSISLFLALSAGCEGFPLQLQLLQLRIRRRMRILSDDQESTESHSPFSPLATCPSPLSCSELLRCTEAQKRLFVSPFLATLTQTPGMRYPTPPRRASLPPSPASRGASIPCALSRLRILPVTTGVWGPLQLFSPLATPSLATFLPSFVFILLQIPSPTTPFVSHPYKSPGGVRLRPPNQQFRGLRWSKTDGIRQTGEERWGRIRLCNLVAQ